MMGIFRRWLARQVLLGLPTVSRLAVRETDAVVVDVDVQHLSAAEAAHVADGIQRLLPGVKVIVLDRRMKLRVVDRASVA